MTKITEHTSNRLQIESKPRFAFGIAVLLGITAVFGSAFSIFHHGAETTANEVFGLAIGALITIGGIILYRETVTLFDKSARVVAWTQRGIAVEKKKRILFSDIQDIVIGRAVSNQSGPTCLSLILNQGSLPLSFGFSSFNSQDTEIVSSIKQFLDIQHD